MISQASLLHEPRVVDSSASAALPWNPDAAVGLPPPPLHLTMHLSRLSDHQAALLLRHVQLIGGSAETAPAGDALGTQTALIAATEAQFGKVCSTLQRLSPELCEAISSTVENYLRRRWLMKCGNHTLELGPRPMIMGIVNVTPDSFSDGGRHSTAPAAIAHAEALLKAGATVIDVGGESTRPGAAEVPADEELARVLPVISELAGRQAALVSVDTRKPQVARQALAAGAAIINDITALADDEMSRLAAESGCGIVLMHMQGEPQTMQNNPQYDEVVSDVIGRLRQALDRATRAGVDLQRTIVDPGIGFGKTLVHNLSLLGRLDELRSLGRPILVGPSRKRFIAALTGDAPADERLSGTIAACLWSRRSGAAIFRVHDVDQVSLALTVAAAMESQAEMTMPPRR